MPLALKLPNETGEYKCSRCNEWKPPEAFNKNKKQRSGINYACRSCTQPYTRGYNLKKRHGISFEDFMAIYNSQEGKCACCGTAININSNKYSERACLDHNHKTGAIRGVLCSTCNLAAGNVKDSSERAEKLSAYLKKWDC